VPSPNGPDVPEKFNQTRQNGRFCFVVGLILLALGVLVTVLDPAATVTIILAFVVGVAFVVVGVLMVRVWSRR
jgi:uncharacterized membrane protein HdeD (DUF308 family)